MTTSADTSSSSPLLSMASQQRAPATSVVATVVVTSASQTIEIPATPKANFSRSLVNCRKSDAGGVAPAALPSTFRIDRPIVFTEQPANHLGGGNMQFTKGKLCPKICHDTKLLEERQLENLFTTVHRCNLCQQEFNNKTDMGMMLHHETVHPEYFNNNIHTAKILVMPSFGTNQSTIDLAPSSHLGIGNTSMCGNGRVGVLTGNASSTGSSSSSILAYNQTPQQFQLQPLFPSVEPLQAPLTASSNLSTIANLNLAASTSKVLFPTTTKSVGIPPLAPPDPVFQRPISGTPNIGNLHSTPSTSAIAQKQGPPVDSPIKSVCRFCGQFSSEGKSFEEFLKHLESKHPGEYIMPLRGSGLKWLCPIAGCRRKYERDEETAKWTFIYRNHLVSHMQTHHGTFKPVRIKNRLMRPIVTEPSPGKHFIQQLHSAVMSGKQFFPQRGNIGNSGSGGGSGGNNHYFCPTPNQVMPLFSPGSTTLSSTSTAYQFSKGKKTAAVATATTSPSQHTVTEEKERDLTNNMNQAEIAVCRILANIRKENYRQPS